jgi:thymidylate synthase
MATHFRDFDSMLTYCCSGLLQKQVDNGLDENAQAFDEVLISSPRGLEIKETLNASLILSDPRKRYLTDPRIIEARGYSYAYLAAELFWYFKNRNDSDFISCWSSFWNNIKNDDDTVNSAYGYRLRKHCGDQWRFVVDELKRDPSSRRAVLHIKDANDNGQAKDTPCTLSLQFFVRENRLHLITNMRSNDVIFGLGYDLPFFTILQEMMANELGVPLGRYYHNAGSLHIYKRHYEMANAVSDIRPLGTTTETKQIRATWDNFEQSRLYLTCCVIMALTVTHQKLGGKSHPMLMKTIYWEDIIPSAIKAIKACGECHLQLQDFLLFNEEIANHTAAIEAVLSYENT